MNHPALDPFVEDRIEAFESEVSKNPGASIDSFLPERGHAKYTVVAAELIRVDMDIAWARGDRKKLAGYVAQYPKIFRDRRLCGELAFEEYRLRLDAGEDVQPQEYKSLFTEFEVDVDTDEWSHWIGYDTKEETAHAADHSTAPRSDRKAALPQLAAGDYWSDFRIIQRLGSGSFANAYLATQDKLADRPVVLKFSTCNRDEADKLARLQHTNITPVHSVHKQDGITVLCMPFFGRTTLADLAKSLRTVDRMPASGKFLLDQIGQVPAISPKLLKLPPIDDSNGAARAFYQERSYVDSILWLAKSLATGLQHSHVRGILHRDIKPANVMLRDDGEPLLIDFNLAANTGQPSDRAGGTMPYIAPETIREMLRRSRGADSDAKEDGDNESGVTADIYSLGVVLYELLSGQLPFTPTKLEPGEGVTDDYLRVVLRKRKSPVPPLRDMNPDVSPATAAIIDRCLSYSASARYQSAQHLVEDLTAQLDSQPLAHAKNPSVVERAQKWVRRHPKICSWTTAAAAVAVIAIGTLFAWQQREFQLAGTQAENRLNRLASKFADLRPAIIAASTGSTNAQTTLQRARDLADSVDLDSGPEGDAWAHLPVKQQQSCRDLCKLLGFHLASMSATNAQLNESITTAGEPGDSTDAVQPLAAALRWNRVADLYETRKDSAIDLQKIRLEQMVAGAPADSNEEEETLIAKLLQSASGEPSDQKLGTQDLMLLGTEFLERDAIDKAIRILEDAMRKRPGDAAGWLQLGEAHFRKDNFQDALMHFKIAKSLLPDKPYPVFRIGHCHLALEEFPKAIEDFTLAMKLSESSDLNPQDNVNNAQMSRSIAHRLSKNLPAAIADASAVIERGTDDPRVYLTRAEMFAENGDWEESVQDRKTGLELRPKDDIGWMTRSHARLGESPRDAIKDLQRALTITTSPRKIRENLAYIHAEVLKDPEKAVRILNDSLDSDPTDTITRAGRGVLLARLRRDETALADAKVLLQSELDAITRYQVACIYALLSRNDETHRHTAIRMLAQSLIEDLRILNHVDGDPDIAPIRDLEQVEDLIAACKRIRELAETEQMKKHQDGQEE